MAKKETEWWHDFFPTFRPVFGLLPAKIINAQIRYVIRKLNLKPGSKFLDCPCGVGRFALPMAARGIKVTGVDFMASYLEEIRIKAARRGLKLELQQNDMRRIDYKNRFDAAANLWTSFGYFVKESDDLLVLKKMWTALKPGGKFMLHVINRDWIITNFSASDWFEIAGLKVLEKRSFDYATSTSRGTWCFIKDGKEKAHDVSIRMYSYHELIAMFRKVGFIDIQGFGSIKDEPISRECRMMFVIGTKA
jgi:ubiquinone/menaquinone biosynthesis C-methylase UbiE